jgi:dTDP-4-amino-4,6-dideoxygalactose transaminase
VKAIVLHHTLGFLPDMEALGELGLPVIEDCSAAYGSALGERLAGSFGQLTILGLEERDMLTAGSGALLYATERRNGAVLRNHAVLPPEFALPDMNAAMAVVQFKEARRSRERRGEIAALYTQAALRSRHKVFVGTNNLSYNNYAFPLILETGFKDVAAYARRKEIDVECAFTNTLIGRDIINHIGYQESYSLSLRTVLFPIYPRLTADNAERVAKLIQTLP